MAVRSTRSVRSLFAGLVLAVTAVVAGPAAASWAHAELVSSTPKAGATLSAVPASASLAFTDEIDPKFVRTAVTSPAGTATVTAGTKGTTVTVPLPADGPGAYRVVYRVVSADGHPVSGELRFRVVGTPAGSASSAAVSPSAAVSASAAVSPTGSASASPVASQAAAAPPEASSSSVALGTSSADGGVSWLVAALALVAVAGAGAVVAATRGRRSS